MSEDDFKNGLDYFEYYVRTLENETPYYDEMNLSVVNPVNPQKSYIDEIVKETYKNGRNIIDLGDYKLSNEESHFLGLFHVFSSTPMNDLIKFRQYKRASYAFGNLIRYWNSIEKKNYNWTHFFPIKMKPETLDQDIELVESEIIEDSGELVEWDDWCSKYLSDFYHVKKSRIEKNI